MNSGELGKTYRNKEVTGRRTEIFTDKRPARSKEKNSFICEAQAAAALNHANIAHIYAFEKSKPSPGEQGKGQLFSCMDYYNGETLNRPSLQNIIIKKVANDLQLAWSLNRDDLSVET